MVECAFDGEKVLEQTVLQPISYDNRISMLHTVPYATADPTGITDTKTAPLP
jgi:hypothetical protein